MATMINFPFRTPPSAIRVSEGSVAVFIFEFENGYKAFVSQEEGQYKLDVFRPPGWWDISDTLSSRVFRLNPSDVDEILERTRSIVLPTRSLLI